VKVRSFRTPRLLVGSLAQGRTILRGFWYLVRRGWPLLALVAMAPVFFLFPHDRELLERLHSWSFTQDDMTKNIARFFGAWGDYLTYNLPLAAGLWIFGAWKKNYAWRRLAVIAFLGATLAGGLDDCFRLTLGRPRPDAHLADGFYGLPAAFNSRFESFPSGHAAAVCGTAAALFVTCLPLGLATTAYALCVVWARLELYRHYPSDIVAGSILGICIGLLVGCGAKVRLQR